MVTVYETSGCVSCRKVREWLKENGIEYQTRNFQQMPLSKKELRSLFILCTDIYELVSVRSLPVKEFYHQNKKGLEDLTFQQLIGFLQTHPLAMRRPIMTDGKHLVSGWDEEEITIFRKRQKQTKT